MSTEDFRRADGTWDWKPKPTIGPVPKIAEKYTFFPYWLPKKPEYATDARVVELGERLMKQINWDATKGKDKLTDHWAKRYAWQAHPFFSGWHKARLVFTGFGYGLTAFLAVIAYEKVTGGSSDNLHGH